MKLTYRFRIKDSTSRKYLNQWSSKTNLIWNYCKSTATKAWQRDRKSLSGYDLNYLTAGSSKELALPAQTIQAIGEQFAKSAKQHKKLPRWRSYKKDLGWIPWKATSLKFNTNGILFNKKHIKLWKSRPLGGPIKAGSFSQDPMGRWYVNIVCEVVEQSKHPNTMAVGLDLGMKDQITGSNGTKYSRPNLSKQHEAKLAAAQRARKPKRIKKIHAKIKNQRKDWIHKTTTKIAKQYAKVVIGNVKTNQIKRKTNRGFNKSLYDASWYQLKTTLKYKAQLLGGKYVEVCEAYTTQKCSGCGARSGPKNNLSIRVWICCECGSYHDRDINAAKNILRMGHHTP